jgi:CheY-like chemotaxis protein
MMQTKSSMNVIDHEILLVERNAMVGNIIVSTVRQLGLRPVKLVTNCRSAQHFMEYQAFDGLITSLDDEDATLLLIQTIRQGSLKSLANISVAITTAQCDAPLAQRIKELGVRRILLKPFKIRDLVATIESMAGLAPG